MADVVVVVAGGAGFSTEMLTQAQITRDSYVIGVDSGISHALHHGLRVDEGVGDFDSVSPDDLSQAIANGAHVERYPSAKDHTDLELGFRAALRHAPKRVVVLGISGGRIDHELANFMLLAHPEFAETSVMAYTEQASIAILHGGASANSRITMQAEPGTLLSLIPVHGSAGGVTAQGVRYPLLKEPLPAASTRGVSNVFAEPLVRISVDEGSVLAIIPERIVPCPGEWC